MIKVIGGWLIQDQATVVRGLHTGPSVLTGRGRAGPIGSLKTHNVIGKDIVFYAKGKYALRCILQLLEKTLCNTYVQCGIRPGMTIEDFERSEYGGGDDQVNRTATEADIARVPYYVYVFEPKASAYDFHNLLVSTAGSMINFIPTTHVFIGAKISRTVMDGGIAAVDARSRHLATSANSLQSTDKAKEACLVISSSQRIRFQPVVTHSHTHSLATLAREIQSKLA